ncbi:MAG TPA: protein-methionine-sulfoxide reductase catalytic subunit MsrP [Anaerolineae bacterium]|nr:protein-methionine-sulfoxide reductase catalytic subunit MsrP [Anaerolineae bacterium]
MTSKWKQDRIPSSEITPEAVYLNRRQFMKGAALVAGGALLAACSPQVAAPPAPTLAPTAAANFNTEKDELGDPLTSYAAVTGYNNYYEFTDDKEGVAGLAKDFKTRPWTVEVSGLVNNPHTYDIDELMKRFPREERVYRLRCVEGWSMVIPWLGFPLNQVLKEAEPTSAAKYVHFISLLDHKQMPGQQSPFFVWPYSEGLRLDEALNDLTLMTTGLYGKDLLPQNGAPLRVVVPWKYGFKSAKAIVKIELVTDQPHTLWSDAAPNEYGFYSNVNPTVPHPRWSQESELRIGESGRRPTLMFNGYSDQVASLYTGMDLRANY